jgi:hypothetical protein
MLRCASPPMIAAIHSSFGGGLYREVVSWSAASIGSCRVPCMDRPLVGAGGWSWRLELSPHYAKWVSAAVSIASDPLRTSSSSIFIDLGHE